MIADGLTGTQAVAERVIEQFLANQGMPVSGDNLTAHLFRGNSRLSPLKWSEVRLQPRLVPAFQILLSEQLLVGLLPSAYEDRLMRRVSHYYIAFHSIEAVWNSPTFLLIFQYLLETARVAVLARSVANYLESIDEAVRARELQDAEEMLTAEGSKLIEMVIAEPTEDRKVAPRNEH